jgi:alpha-tubulin suppressor-like RCC1 family protein
MRIRLILAATVLSAAGIVACADDAILAPPSSPLASISDAVHNQGNLHFFFLPPMVADPSAVFLNAFDGSLNAEVEICVWKVADEECGPSLAIFNMNTGPGSETVRVPDGEEHYVANWHTNEILNDFPLVEGEEVYRIRVVVGVQELGHADVKVVGSGRELKNVDTDEYIPLRDGRTLPIKFRIEEGFGGDIVSAGLQTSCAVDAGGDAYCWGDGRWGQLGNNTYTDRQTTPALVDGGHTFESVSAGTYHSCGVTTSGDAYCWGYNYYGQLGTGSANTIYFSVPQQVTGGHTFQSVALGDFYSCGVTSDGNGYCWGNNGYGNFGTGGYDYIQPTPVPAAGTLELRSLRSAGATTCGLTTAGQAYCFGLNANGQLGTGSYSSSPTPQPVSGGHTFQSLDTGWYHTCGATTEGEAYCWGYNWDGELGDGTFTRTSPFSKPSPVLVVGGHHLISVSCGNNHSCALAEGGAAYCWGFNWTGALGDGTFTGGPYYGKASPVLVVGDHTFLSVSAGAKFTCGATAGGYAYCWGYNYHGQLGDDTYTWRSAPTFTLDLDPPPTP